MIPEQVGADIYQIRAFNSSGMEVLNHRAIEGIVVLNQGLYQAFLNVLGEFKLTGFPKFKVVYDPSLKNNSKIDAIQRQFSLATPNERGFFQTLEFDHLDSEAQEKLPYQVSINFTNSMYNFTHGLQSACTLLNPTFKSALKPFAYAFSRHAFGSYRLAMMKFAEGLKGNYPLLFNGDKFQGVIFLDNLQIVLDQVFKFDHTKVTSYRTEHHTLLSALRVALSSYENYPDSPLKVQALEFIDEINYWIYTNSVLLSPWHEKLLSLMPDFSSRANKGFIESFAIVWEALQNSPNLAGCYQDDSSDLHLQGSFSAVLFQIGPTRFIRMPSVVTYSDKEVLIAPEFLNFLNILNGQFLFVNLMQTTGYEREWTKEVHDLETEYGLSNIRVITLDRNSEYALATGLYAANKENGFGDSTFYKKDLKEHFCGMNWESNTPFVLNMNALSGEQKQEHDSKIEEIINRAHIHYFKNSPSMSDLERAVFNELIDVEIVYRLVKEGNFEYMTAACRGTMDRGPSFFTLLYLRHLLEESKQLNQEQIQKLIFLFFIHAIMSENRLPHKIRIDLFLHSAQKMLECGPLVI